MLYCFFFPLSFILCILLFFHVVYVVPFWPIILIVKLFSLSVSPLWAASILLMLLLFERRFIPTLTLPINLAEMRAEFCVLGAALGNTAQTRGEATSPRGLSQPGRIWSSSKRRVASTKKNKNNGKSCSRLGWWRWWWHKTQSNATGRCDCACSAQATEWMYARRKLRGSVVAVWVRWEMNVCCFGEHQ